jgi:hypothetical protein
MKRIYIEIKEETQTKQNEENCVVFKRGEKKKKTRIWEKDPLLINHISPIRLNIKARLLSRMPLRICPYLLFLVQ